MKYSQVEKLAFLCQTLGPPEAVFHKIPQEKNQVEAISLVSSILSISILGSHFYYYDKQYQDWGQSWKSWEIISRCIECFSYLKKHDLENYVKEEATDPEGDEDKTKHKKDLVKAKRIIFISIGSHMYHPYRLLRIYSM